MLSSSGKFKHCKVNGNTTKTKDLTRLKTKSCYISVYHLSAFIGQLLRNNNRWNEEIQGSVENVSPRRWIIDSLSLLQLRSSQFSQGLLRLHFTTWTSRNNRETARRCLTPWQIVNVLLGSFNFWKTCPSSGYGVLFSTINLHSMFLIWFRCTTINLLRMFKAVIYFAQQQNVSITNLEH